MLEKEILTLMYQDFEVLTFEVDYKKERIRIIEKLEHFDKAPYGVTEDSFKLMRFFNARSISAQRSDYEAILKATKCKSGFELSFKGHGLSLANHYWFKREGEDLKYGDINFFANKWDDTFGRAVLSGDYEALKTCDLNVPDIVISGWGVKGWIYDNGPKLYKLGIHNEYPEEAICEVLAAKLASRLLSPEEVLQYELKTINGKYASVSKPLITVDEELVPLSILLPPAWYLMFKEKNANRDLSKEFFKKVENYDMPELYQFFVKVSCLRTLCFVSDLHFDNLSAIRNMKTGKLKMAPLYDLGGAFGSSESGKSMITNANKGTLLIIYFMFGDLSPDWDYSWYKPEKLVGIEDVIREYLSKSDFYNPEIIDCVIEIYHQQKKTLDEIAKKN